MKRSLIFVPLTLALVVFGLVGEAQWAHVTSGTQRGAPCDLCPGLVNYWPLDEAAGQRNDIVGTAHLADGNTVGTAAGMHNLAAHFIALNSERLTKANYTFPAEFTLAVWAKAPAAADTHVFSHSPIWPEGVNLWYEHAQGKINLTIGRAGGDFKTIRSTAITVTNWNLYAVTFDSSFVARVYANDGAPTVATAMGGVPTGNNTIRLGQYISGPYVNVDEDEMAIWSRPLSAPGIAEYYNAGAGIFYDGSTFADLWMAKPWRNARADWLLYRGPRRVLP